MIQRKQFVLAAGTLMAAGLISGVAQADPVVADNATREVAPTHMADFFTRGLESTVAAHKKETLDAMYPTSDPATYRSAVFVFVLPDVKGEPIASADFSFSVTDVMNPKSSANTALDFYAVRYAANTPGKQDTEGDAATDHYGGEYAEAGNSGTGIQDDIVPVSDTAENVGRYNTDEAAQAALGAWLQAQYDAGAVAGDYVFLRLSPDRAPLATSRGYQIASADHTDETLRPVLTLILGTPSETPPEGAPENTSEESAPDDADQEN